MDRESVEDAISVVCGLVEQASFSRPATWVRSTMYVHDQIWMHEEQRLFHFDCNAAGL
jgi:hypothetical protein